MSSLDWDNLEQATNEQLAEAILSKQGSAPAEAFFLRLASRELAQRIAPNAEVKEKHGVSGNKSQGEAKPRNTRMQKAVIENWEGRYE